MYIIAIAWLYVTVLMAATEKSVTAGVLTFVFYGLLPCAILLWLLGTKHRQHKRNQANTKAETRDLLDEHVDQPDGTNPQRNE